MGDLLLRLENVVFHAKLGSVGDKVRRIERLSQLLAPACGADETEAATAARHAKADLVSIAASMNQILSLTQGLVESNAELVAKEAALLSEVASQAAELAVVKARSPRA